MKTALITGATRGIGRHSAISLARRGFDVAVTGRTRKDGDSPFPGSLESVVAAIEAEGRRAVPIVLDLLDRQALVPAVEAAIAELDHLDVVLNNAIYVGPAEMTGFADAPPDEVEKRIFGNLTAHLLLAQPVLRHMVERGSGVLAFTTSAAGWLPPPGPPGAGGWALTYGVSKAGLNRIAEQLVVEHPEIRTYNLSPGSVATERYPDRGGAPVEVVGEAFARVLDAAPGMFPNGSTIEVQDIARIWGLLPSPDSGIVAQAAG